MIHEEDEYPELQRDRYLSLAELSALSGLSLRTLRAHLAAPEHSLPCYRVGRRVLVKVDEFHAWMTQHRQRASAAEQLVRKVMREA